MLSRSFFSRTNWEMLRSKLFLFNQIYILPFFSLLLFLCVVEYFCLGIFDWFNREGNIRISCDSSSVIQLVYIFGALTQTKPVLLWISSHIISPLGNQKLASVSLKTADELCEASLVSNRRLCKKNLQMCHVCTPSRDYVANSCILEQTEIWAE